MEFVICMYSKLCLLRKCALCSSLALCSCHALTGSFSFKRIVTAMASHSLSTACSAVQSGKIFFAQFTEGTGTMHQRTAFDIVAFLNSINFLLDAVEKAFIFPASIPSKISGSSEVMEMCAALLVTP